MQGPGRTRRGIVAIIFSGHDSQRVFLLLRRCLNWRGWEFVKGGIEENENSADAVKREIAEETGIGEVSLIKKLPGKNTWSAKGADYIYETFIVRVPYTANIKLAKGIREHDDYKWCSAGEAFALLTHGNSRDAMRKAVGYLEKNNATG